MFSIFFLIIFFTIKKNPIDLLYKLKEKIVFQSFILSEINSVNLSITDSILFFNFIPAFKITKKYYSKRCSAEAFNLYFSKCDSWRKGGDSNSRYRFQYATFPRWCTRPLCDPSLSMISHAFYLQIRQSSLQPIASFLLPEHSLKSQPYFLLILQSHLLSYYQLNG